MIKTNRRERRIRVCAIRRKDPDLRKLARALIELAQAQAEADAQSDHEAKPAAANESPPAEGQT